MANKELLANLVARLYSVLQAYSEESQAEAESTARFATSSRATETGEIDSRPLSEAAGAFLHPLSVYSLSCSLTYIEDQCESLGVYLSTLPVDQQKLGAKTGILARLIRLDLIALTRAKWILDAVGYEAVRVRAERMLYPTTTFPAGTLADDVVRNLVENRLKPLIDNLIEMAVVQAVDHNSVEVWRKTPVGATDDDPNDGPACAAA